MSDFTTAVVFLIYGLAFILMAVVVLLERQRTANKRLRGALRPLAGFGLLHGTHEWLELLQHLDLLPGTPESSVAWESLRLFMLALSFISLSAFGSSLVAPSLRWRRMTLLIPLAQATVWGLGLLVLKGWVSDQTQLPDVADVWSRYILGVPSALMATAGLIVQQRAFRMAGMARFGRDSLWAASAFAVYGLLGQVFTRYSVLPPSDVVNADLFLQWFGFPVQILRASAAAASSLFMVRSLRAIEVEVQEKISELQAARIAAAEERELLRSGLLRRVVLAQEAERRRIARELHDDTGQALTALGLGIRGTRKEVADMRPNIARNLSSLEGLISQSLEGLQRMIHDLRPPQLDDLGLSAALRWWCRDFSTRTDIQASFRSEGTEVKLTPPLAIAVFRVAQEAMNNAMKHSRADTVDMTLRFNESTVSLDVHDDGDGFDLVAVMSRPQRKAWGIMGMNERASLLSGTFHVESVPGRGTHVRMVCPYGTDDEEIRIEESHNDKNSSG